MRGNFDYTSNTTAMDVIRQAARRTARKFENAEYDDLVQEAHVLVSTTANLQEPIETGEWGLLQHRLEQDLSNVCMKVVRRTNKNVAYTEASEGVGDSRTVAHRQFSDLGSSGFRGGSEPTEHPVTTRKAVA